MATLPTKSIYIGARSGGASPQQLELKRANRHGLIAGATGTGKTVTLQGIVEGLSQAGIPTFVADVKGDLAGLAMPGAATAKTHEPFTARAAEIGYTDWAYAGCPVQFWDLFGESGHPVRTTVSEMGPLLLARLMNLNEVQEGVLTIAFHVADKEGLMLLDLDDLQAMLVHVGERADELTLEYGNVSKPSVGAIQRSLLQLRAQGGDHFFGEPALDLEDFLKIDENGQGIVNILAADKLMASPRLYSTFLLWLLSELFEQLPEVGDTDQPKLAFFFDEAHLLFEDAPPALIEKVEQVVRLIRSKAVGVYFITQNPIDIPDKVAGQLGNRVQHALRAFTPRDQAAVRSAAETFRQNPDIDVATAITELKVGEALVSLLLPDGSPSPVERVLIKPPASRVGPLTAQERAVLIQTDVIGAKYDTLLDRDSAEEILKAKGDEAAAAAAAAKADTEAKKAAAQQAKLDAAAAKETARANAAEERARVAAMREEERQARLAEREEARRAREAAKPSMADKMMQSAGRSIASSVGRQLGNSLLRGIFGGLIRGR
ncbi:helicase HerA-like domain-containing protein [Sphingomonas sp. LY160]|uniref:helicase HerA-like domain-containing protein n=1 Tax=Sphingomonas sp. LY160 TaxID=3095342 RepID=UPI002ADEEE0F|nr:helicase HerA-like domain-containing protein [Sphingomonas sp. LY160]MEA1071967.1 helicase HerA-like domain-containing protein [Sphingomonas sp. LY160]